MGPFHVPRSKRNAPAARYRVAVEPPLLGKRKDCSEPRSKDWASCWQTLTSIWGLPAVAMIASAWVDPTLRTFVWTAMLVWMGIACLMNAWRCGRTHCRFTGPFFLVMAALALGYGSGRLQLGFYGWAIIGSTACIGNALIWWCSERLLGKFARR